MNALNTARAVLSVVAGMTALILALPVVMLVLPFWIVGALTRALGRYLEPRPITWDQLIEYYPEVGWKPKANLDAHALDFNGDTYHLSTDSSGWRGRRSLEDSDVVVFGDSYAFGCGVDDAAFFADLSNEVRIKAIGAPAYSMVQPLLWMEELAGHLSGKLVIWLVYLGNDLDDSLRPSLLEYRAPFVRSLNGAGRWQIFSEHVNPSRWTITSQEGSVESFVDLCHTNHHSQRVFAACEYLIERAREVCEGVGARLVVMTVPDLSPVARSVIDRILQASDGANGFDEDLPDRRLRQACQSSGVEFIALKDHLDSGDYLDHDFHWNPRGHYRVAKIIQQLFADHKAAEVGPLSVKLTPRVLVRTPHLEE